MFRIFSIIFLLVLALSCQKSNLQDPTGPSSQKPVKSIVITYPLEQGEFSVSQTHYQFDTDSLNDRLIIYGTDSVYSSSLSSYTLLKSVKIYYFSEDFPKRVEKITFRRYLERQYGGADYYDYGDYDADFMYSDYSPHPNEIQLTVYRDYSGFILKDQFTNVVQQYSNYYTGPFQDILSLSYYQATRRGLRTEIWGGTQRIDYGDTLDEVQTLDSYYLPVFFNDPEAFPVDSRYIATQSAYIYNADQTCRTFAIDLEGNDFLNVFGQRKFDFTYSEDSKDLNHFLPVYNPADVIFWDNIAARYAGIPGPGKLAGNYSDAYNYFPDLYSFYQDASVSYTDSLFVVDGTNTKKLRNASTYYNKIVRDSEGNISTITKTNQSDSVFRKIELFY